MTMPVALPICRDKVSMELPYILFARDLKDRTLKPQHWGLCPAQNTLRFLSD